MHRCHPLGLDDRSIVDAGKQVNAGSYSLPETHRLLTTDCAYHSRLDIPTSTMLSYRHAYHAGNHADVLKHLCLMLCLQHMNGKDKPYTVIDTHAGAGLYSLDEDKAKRTGEFIDGIARLWDQKTLPESLAAYVELIRSLNTNGTLKRYPGSPWIAERMTRDSDRVRLHEMHSTDFALLRRQFKEAGKRITVEQSDGFDGLKAALPPPSRRGLVLIDPSYEIKSDYLKVYAAIKDGLKRFATGTYLVWLPFLPSIESRSLPDKLKKLPVDWLCATLTVRGPATQGHGMTGSAMLIINPPWTLKAALDVSLPWLAEHLQQDGQSDWKLEASPASGAKPRAE